MTQPRIIASTNRSVRGYRNEYSLAATSDPEPEREGLFAGRSLAQLKLASNALALQHLDLVRQIALALRRRLATGACVDDLVGAGNLGLVEAARRFEPSRGSFVTFARHRIRGAMIDGLRAIDPLSRCQRSRARLVNLTIETLTSDLGRQPYSEEIAERLDITPSCWKRISRELRGEISLVQAKSTNQPTDPDELPATGPDQESYAAIGMLRELLQSVLKELPPRHGSVIRLHYFSGWSIKRIAGDYGVTESRARQIHHHALVQLRTQLSARNCGPGAI